MTKVTKTSVTLGVMAANGDKPMAVVVPMILEAQHAAGFLDVTMKICEGAYRWAVRKAVAPGSVPEKVKATRAPKAPKAKTKAQALKAIKAVKAVSKSTAPTKSPEEIERIRAANLARLKEVSARLKKSDEPEARHGEIEFGERDPFSAPAFLTKDELKALV